MKKLDAINIAIIGLGQIGASLGYDFVAHKIGKKVIGYDVDGNAVRQAVKKKAIHAVAATLDAAIKDSDLIVLATPIRTTIKIIPRVIRLVGTDVAVMDVAGTKSEIFKTLERLAAKCNYISTHPMAGDEGSGFAAAAKGKFKGARAIITPYPGVNETWISAIKAIYRAIGAEPTAMSPAEHDRLISATSQLPYAVAIALMDFASQRKEYMPRFDNLVAGSFKSATRVAVSDENLTLDMFLTNAAHTADSIDALIDNLQSIKEKIRAGDEKGLKKIIRAAAKTRSKY